MRVLVTGGAGFIGSNLVHACVAAGDQVRVLDDLSTGRRQNLGSVSSEIEFVEGSVADPEVCRRAAAGCEIVYHQAALPSVAMSVEDPQRTHRVNSVGTLNLLSAAREAGVRRVVYAASCAVYGSGGSAPRREDLPPDPLSPYAVQKYTGELYCQQFARHYGLETAVLRYFNVFGPRQDPASPYAAVIPIFMRALRRGEPPTIYGDGLQTRDFVYVKDVVEANRAAAAGGPESSGQVFNVGRGEERSLLEILDMIAKALGCAGVQPYFLPARAGDVRNSRADIGKIERVLGWRPRFGLEEGLRATAACLG
jgi:nucleoside-diphosphate-sugar epimerase